MTTKVKHLMTENPEVISPVATLKEAAQKMKEIRCGVLPVGSADNLEGIITDRDIVIRAIAQGKNPSHEKVEDYMTDEMHTCREDETLQDAAKRMRQHNVSRLVVQDNSGRTTGIITFGAILRKNPDEEEVSHVVQSAVRKEAA